MRFLSWFPCALAAVVCTNFATRASVTFSNATLTGQSDVDTNGALLGAFNTGTAAPSQAFLVGGNIYAPAGNPLGRGFTGANPANAMVGVDAANFNAALNTASYGTSSLTLSGLNIGDS